MKKRRKSKKLEEKRSIKVLDKLFAHRIKERDKVCVVCKATKYLNTAHIIPREVRMFRWDDDNAVLLCAKHHKFGMFSFHRNPFMMILWLIKYRKSQIYRLIEKIVKSKYWHQIIKL